MPLKLFYICMYFHPPCSSAVSCWAESSPSPSLPQLCSDEPPCCCGWLPLLFGTFADFVFPAQQETTHFRICNWRIMKPQLISQLIIVQTSCCCTLFKASTCCWRVAHFCTDSSTNALCFSICVCWTLVVFCSLTHSFSISFICALSFAFPLS